jgi:phosphate starvation-inducible protein PhoH
MKGIGHIELDGRDVVRHPLVRKIIAAYDAEGQSRASRTAREADQQPSKN